MGRWPLCRSLHLAENEGGREWRRVVLGRLRHTHSHRWKRKRKPARQIQHQLQNVQLEVGADEGCQEAELDVEDP
jgi:hypothetical protein